MQYAGVDILSFLYLLSFKLLVKRILYTRFAT